MTENPNLLFVWTDQQRFDTMSAYGNDRIETPNLDALADRSAVFERAYCAQPICGPSRSTVMSGLYPHATGYTENNIHLPPDAELFPELLEDDYATGFVGKWHLGDEVFAQHGFEEFVSTEDGYHAFFSEGRDPDAKSTYHDFLVGRGYEPDVEDDDGTERFSRGFAARLPEEDSKATFMADRAIDFVERHRDEPFVLHVMFLEPHNPFTSPRDDQYDPDDVSLPENFAHDGFDDQPLKTRLFRKAFSNGVGTPDVLGDSPTEADWRELISNYWGLVSLIDTHAGRILDAVDDAGLGDETITVFTSDHGEMMGGQGLLYKSICYEEAMRIPLLLRIPGEVEGGRVEHPVSQVDLVPTLLDAMGQPLPEHVHGGSWLPALRGDGELPEYVFAEWNGCAIPGMGRAYSESGENADPSEPREDYMAVWEGQATPTEAMRAMTEPTRTVITADGWKLNYRRSGEHELYDLDADPHETRNLAGERPGLVDELALEIFEWQNRTLDPVYLY